VLIGRWGYPDAALQAGTWQIGWAIVCTARRLESTDMVGSARRWLVMENLRDERLVWAREASREHARRDGYALAQSKQMFFESCDVLFPAYAAGKRKRAAL